MSLTQQFFNLNDINKPIYTFFENPSKIWFRGKDVAETLGYKNSRDALKKHVPAKYKSTWGNIEAAKSVTNLPLNWNPHTIFILEPGIYFLISRSKLPEAEKFNDWIFNKVVPSIPQTQYDKLQEKLAQMTIKDKENTKLLQIAYDMLNQKDKQMAVEFQKLAMIPQKSEEEGL